MTQDNRLIAATLTVAVNASREHPLQSRASDGQTNVQIVFNEYEQFLDLLDAREKAQGEPGMAL